MGKRHESRLAAEPLLQGTAVLLLKPGSHDIMLQGIPLRAPFPSRLVI
jgi:hypothetical protein